MEWRKQSYMSAGNPLLDSSSQRMSSVKPGFSPVWVPRLCLRPRPYQHLDSRRSRNELYEVLCKRSTARVPWSRPNLITSNKPSGAHAPSDLRRQDRSRNLTNRGPLAARCHVLGTNVNALCHLRVPVPCYVFPTVWMRLRWNLVTVFVEGGRSGSVIMVWWLTTLRLVSATDSRCWSQSSRRHPIVITTTLRTTMYKTRSRKETIQAKSGLKLSNWPVARPALLLVMSGCRVKLQSNVRALGWFPERLLRSSNFFRPIKMKIAKVRSTSAVKSNPDSGHELMLITRPAVWHVRNVAVLNTEVGSNAQGQASIVKNVCLSCCFRASPPA